MKALRAILFASAHEDVVVWAGLYAVGVGLLGIRYNLSLRHYALWGVLRLDWFYDALLLSGLLVIAFGMGPLFSWSSPGFERTKAVLNMAWRITLVVALAALGYRLLW